MIYFWSKYNNIRMDFSDFSEFIGPIIFGLIAWLSNYFGKKKKPSKNDPTIEKKPDKTLTKRVERLDGYKIKEERNEEFENELFDELKDSSSLKKAFLFKEILKRKF